MNKLIYVIIIILVVGTNVDAQILNRVVRKVENRLADKLADKIFESIEDDVDDSLQEAYKRDSINGETSGSFSEYMKRVSEGVEVPEGYTFDIVQVIKYTDEKGNESESTNLYSMEGNYFGVLQEDKKGRESITVFDGDNEILVMYDNDKMTCSAVPSMMKLASSYARDQADKYEYTTIEKTGKTRRIVGYRSDEYYVESKVYSGNVYITDEVDINMGEKFAKMFAGYLPETNRRMSEVNGLSLQSEIVNKENDKTIITRTISLKKKTFKLDSSDYKQEERE